VIELESIILIHLTGLGPMFLPSDDPSSPATAGRGFLRRVKSLLGDALDKSRITTVQALLLLSSSLGALGEHGSGWMYSGIGEDAVSRHSWFINALAEIALAAIPQP
jgi:hypothetical protein